MKSLGIIAGGGLLPARLITACEDRGIDPFIIAFDGHTDPEIYKDHKHMVTRIGAAGRIINTLKCNNIRDLVFIGSIRRPTIYDMRPDFRAIQFFLRMLVQSMGDDGLLKGMRRELEREGFQLHGIQDFVPDLLAGDGALGKIAPAQSDHPDIDRAIGIIRTLSPSDVGQGVVVQAGVVLGIEAAEGTDQLIRRCAGLKRQGRGPILVKMSKDGQDSALDLPTIGPETVRAAQESGFSGIVIESGRTLVLDPDRVANIADECGIFVTALKKTKI